MAVASNRRAWWSPFSRPLGSETSNARSYLTTTDASVLNPAEEGVDVVKDIFSKLQYEVIDEERDGNTTVVTTNVTSVDLVRVMGQVMQELLPVAMASAFSDDNVNTEALTQQYMLNAIRSEDAPKTTSKVRVTLRRTDDGWKIEPDDALLNGVTGNLITAMKSFE